MNAGHRPESFSIQLVCLAIWKEALRVCQTDSGSGGSANDADNQERSTASSRSLIEQEFASAFERAEFFSTYIDDDASAELPDAMELIYQTALALGRGGAVDEFMGSMTNAASAYEKGAALLNFLVVEATALPIKPPLLLSDGDRHRLRHYAKKLTAHQLQCIASAQKLTS
jgi:serine/threonine-protein kinase ULK/ATG1